jgi:hypothetical protein
MNPEEEKNLQDLFDNWPARQEGLKRCLNEIKDAALAIPEVVVSFISRPGVSHSLRFDLDPRPDGRIRPLVFMSDVVDLGGELMLSVCFFQDEITDPEELGDAIPQGLYGENGYCFDVDEYDPGQVAYLMDRLAEAVAKAKGQA